MYVGNRHSDVPVSEGHDRVTEYTEDVDDCEIGSVTLNFVDKVVVVQ